MTFVGLGAFPDVYNAKKKKSGKMSIGFGTAAKDEQFDEQHVIITEDDIVKDGGLLAELVGRFSNQIVFPKLTKEDIRNIILHSKDSYFLRKIDRFQKAKSLRMAAYEIKYSTHELLIRMVLSKIA